MFFSWLFPFLEYYHQEKHSQPLLPGQSFHCCPNDLSACTGNKKPQELVGDFINSQKCQALCRHLAGREDALLPLSQQSGGRRECVWRGKSHPRAGHEPPRSRMSHRTLQLQVGSPVWAFLQLKSHPPLYCDLMCVKMGWNQESLQKEEDGKGGRIWRLAEGGREW